jgi:endoglucanase
MFGMYRKKRLRLIAICLLVLIPAAVIFSGCGAKTGEQTQPDGDKPTAGSVAEVPDGSDEAASPAEPKEGTLPGEEASSGNGGREQPTDDTTPSADSEKGTSTDGGTSSIDTGSTDGPAQGDEKSVKIPELNIEKQPIPGNEALAFVKNMKVGWNLGNTFDAVDATRLTNKLEYEWAWVGVKTTEEMIRAVKDAGFNTIRIPVSWHNHVSGDDYTIDEPWLDRVQEVVDYAVRNELYIIINIHHDMGRDFIYPTRDYLDQSKRYVGSIWSQVAERFKDYDHRVIFESMNEPRIVGHKNEWWPDPNDADIMDAVECINELNQLFVDTVRATGSNNRDRYLMVPGYCASFAGATVPGFRIPADTVDNRIIISVHAYTPYNFALQDGGIRTFDISRQSSTKDINYFMDILYDSFVSKGIPVVIGEFGARNKKDNLQDRVDFTAYYVAYAAARGMTCIVWDNHGFTGSDELFGLLDRKAVEWRYPEIVEALIKYAQ